MGHPLKPPAGAGNFIVIVLTESGRLVDTHDAETKEFYVAPVINVLGSLIDVTEGDLGGGGDSFGNMPGGTS
jgi:hypothetical protein